MGNFRKVGLILLIGVIGYLLGIFLPFEFLVPEFANNSIDLSDYLSLIVQSIAAFSTFLAVIVALFKEDFRKLWKSPNLIVRLTEDKITEQLNNEASSEGSSNDHLVADKYTSHINIKNDGNKSASEVELVLDQLSFESTKFPNTQFISTDPITLSWNSAESKKVDLSPKSKKRIQVLELTNLEEQSSPDGSEKSFSPTLKIGPIESPNKYQHGTWTAEFVLHSKDSIPVRFKLKIIWNGKWEKRLTEMKDCLSLDIEEDSL